MTDLAKQFADGVYVLSPEGLLTHNAGCFMEGLIDLGVPVHTNAAKLTSRHVSMPLRGRDLKDFHSEPRRDFAAYVVDISHTNSHVPLDGVDGKILAYLTTSDSSAFCRIPDEFLLFSTHENRFADKGGTRIPVAFGPTNWLIQKTEGFAESSNREDRVLKNFRPTLSQGVRAMLDLSLVPHLAKHIDIDTTDYPPGEYLAALQTASACLTYGGDFYTPLMHSDWFARHEKELHDLHSFARLEKDALILRWDSWRLWESMVAGCVAIHLDFEKYGFDLPVLPEPWVHYIPIDLDRVEESATELLDRRTEWPRIAADGRNWAIEHYAPAPTAARMLKAMSEVLP